MVLPADAYLTMLQYRDKVVDIDRPDIRDLAMNIAYWSAMRDAAVSEPMDETDDQAQALAFIDMWLVKDVETFQKLINEVV